MHNETTYTLPEQEGQMVKEPAAITAYATCCQPQTIVLTVPEGQSAKYLKGKVVDFYATLLNESKKAKREFNSHYKKWMTETMFLSSTNRITNHPDFQAIVDMGEDAVPFIVEKLEQTPSFLYKALELIYKKKMIYPEAENVNGTVWTKERPIENCRLWLQRLK